MRDGERFQHVSRALLQAYLGAVEAIPAASLPANPELFEACSARLAAVAAALRENASAKEVERNAPVPLEELERIRQSNQEALEAGDTAVREVLAAAAAAINGLRAHGDRHNAELVRVAGEFEALARVDDAAELRRRLKNEVSRLRTSLAEMRDESDGSLEEFTIQIAGYQRRLDQGRQPAVDRLTGLNNRRALEREARLRLAENRPFSLMLFDLDNFGVMNETFGRAAGDHLLQYFADVLRRHVATDSAIYRWGPDEFVILVPAGDSLPELVRRANEIAAAYRVGEYYAVREGRQIPVARSASFGCAESIEGESLETVYQRARELLEGERAKRY